MSDEETKERADFDLRRNVALGIVLNDKPFVKSILQLFRAHLISRDKVRVVFQRSLRFARQKVFFKVIV